MRGYNIIKNGDLSNNPRITQGFDNLVSSSDVDEIVKCEGSDLDIE